MQALINRHEYSLDGIVDSVIELLTNAKQGGKDVYLVYSEFDPDFTVELDDGSFIMRDKGVHVAYSSANVERMFFILLSPVFDYK
mgnify:CR=1 FL=1